MSEFMPLERHEIAQFGQLTAMQIDVDTVIVLELKPGVDLPDHAAVILRDRLKMIFPSNPIVVIDPEKMSLKVVDQPEATAPAKPTAWEIFSPVAVELAAIVIVLSAKKVIRRIRRRRAA
ncbi:hypothetical protein ACFYU5_19290 [Nocardia aobensis]|uniref:Uncharacterized protein n=1 Tax=Nocardia aobensis TaxID=257277 RepID=A0ABW6P5X9_9NOCA